MSASSGGIPGVRIHRDQTGCLQQLDAAGEVGAVVGDANLQGFGGCDGYGQNQDDSQNQGLKFLDGIAHCRFLLYSFIGCCGVSVMDSCHSRVSHSVRRPDRKLSSHQAPSFLSEKKRSSVCCPCFREMCQARPGPAADTRQSWTGAHAHVHTHHHAESLRDSDRPCHASASLRMNWLHFTTICLYCQ